MGFAESLRSELLFQLLKVPWPVPKCWKLSLGILVNSFVCPNHLSKSLSHRSRHPMVKNQAVVDIVKVMEEMGLAEFLPGSCGQGGLQL